MSANTRSARHPSRTARNTLKIRQLASGLVFERASPDAHDMVASGGFAFADAEAESILDALLAMSAEALRDLCRTAGRSNVGNEPADAMVRFLLPLIESGSLTLP